METPFVFGKLAKQNNFTDREQETQHLIRNFNSLINTIIISPRRWGKSSLVYKAAQQIMSENTNIKVCIIDLFNVKTEAEFYCAYAESIIKNTASRWEEMAENTKKFFTNLLPKFNFSADPFNSFSLNFDFDEVVKNPDEVLDLAENIAAAKGLKIVVCIDEFQNLANFSDSVAFQRKLRAHFQQHEHVSYCLYGSKRHMMLDVFTNPNMPFYNFGDLLFLEKIDTEHWIDFIVSQFKATGKTISPETATHIVELMENHPYYVQQLSQLAWLRTTDKCGNDIVDAAHNALIQQFGLVFATLIETLTSQQINYLKAVLNNEKKLTSKATLKRYNITSSSVAIRSRDALIEKDILDSKMGQLSIIDPIFGWWLKHEYFNKSIE